MHRPALSFIEGAPIEGVPGVAVPQGYVGPPRPTRLQTGTVSEVTELVTRERAYPVIPSG